MLSNFTFLLGNFKISLSFLFFILSNLLFSKAEKALNDVNIIDADKSNPLMIKIKEYQLDRLRAIFNRISVTVQSQENAVSALFEKILLTKDNPDLLRYLLFKIVQNLLKDTQGEHFKIEDEAQPMRISRVICSLCMKINVLTDFVKSQFYMTCPLLYPKVISEGLSTHDFFISMAFNTKPTKDNSVLDSFFYSNIYSFLYFVSYPIVKMGK